MTYEISGMIHAINDTESFGTKGFKKRKFVLHQPNRKDSRFDQFIELEFQRDRCGKLDAFNVSETVTVKFDINGREHNGRCYNTLVAWDIEHGAGRESAPRRSGGDKFSRPPANFGDRDGVSDSRQRETSATRGSTYRGKNAYNPPADDGENDIPF